MVNPKEDKHRLSISSETKLKRKEACSKSLLPLLMLCIAFLFISNTWAVDTASKTTSYIVEDLRVEDVPNDDGSGLRVSWIPLDKEKRIIEYRVYRGLSPDSLYFVGSIPVNPSTGFAGDRVNYFDSGYNLLADISSPAKQKKEQHQPKDSPLYRKMPRDMKVLGPQLEHYNILGMIPTKQFYYNAKLVDVEENGQTNQYAGLHLRQFQSLYKKLLPNREYFYTVIAVSETRHYYPHAEIKSGIPRVNAPERTREFYAIYIDELNRLQFEWSLPVNSDILQFSNVYLVHQKDLEAFKNYDKKLEEYEQNRVARQDNPDIPEIKMTLSNPATLIFRRQFTTESTAFVQIEEGRIVDENLGINVSIDPNQIDKYYAVFSLKDYYGMENFSSPVSFENVVANDLPLVPNLTITDKPNDQGDYLSAHWGMPVVFTTNTSFLNKDKTKVKISYESETNIDYNIKNIYFDVYDDEGVLIESIDEFYQDSHFNISLPEKYSVNSPEYDINRNFEFRIRMKTTGKELPENYVLKQTMYYDEDYRSYQALPLTIESNGHIEHIQEYNYALYKKAFNSETFRLVIRSAGIIRQTDDSVKYETLVYKGANKYDPNTGLILVDTSINAYYDKEKKMTVNTDVFYSIVEKKIAEYRDEIKELNAKLTTVQDDQEKAQIKARIKSYEQYLAFNEGEFLKTANSLPNDKARMKYIKNRREKELRTFEYKLVKTDGKASFVETDVYRDADGNSYHYPVANWFNKERFPTLIASLIFGFLVFFMIRRAKQGHEMYIRPIAGLQEIDNAIGRATEMGRPILFQPGLSGIGDVATLAGLSILGKVATKAAEYDTKIIVPVRDYIVMPIAQEIVKDAHYEAGRPDTYDKSSVFFITTDQFAFVAGVNGVMIREKCATCFYMGMYYAEALLMTETGNAIGAVQIAGSDAITQIPFFITTCDYTLIGEELYGASAYLSHEPQMVANLKAVDVAKILILACIILGTAFSTAQLTFFINIFPDK